MEIVKSALTPFLVPARASVVRLEAPPPPMASVTPVGDNSPVMAPLPLTTYFGSFMRRRFRRKLTRPIALLLVAAGRDHQRGVGRRADGDLDGLQHGHVEVDDRGGA